jgi:DNA-binding NarL/FixJ family response regulator
MIVATGDALVLTRVMSVMATVRVKMNTRPRTAETTTEAFREIEKSSSPLLAADAGSRLIIRWESQARRRGGLMRDDRGGDQDGGITGMRIAVVSEIRLYREGLAPVLSALDDVAEVVTHATVLDCIEVGRRLAPDVVLLDMSSADSAAAARLVARELASTRIVALAVPETEPSVLACVEAGVSGYVPRGGTIDDLVAAVRLSVRGEALCSPVITAGLMRRVATLAHANGPARRLTTREEEIAEHIALGLSNRAIATRLGIEICTVKNHVHNILDKLGLDRRADIFEGLHR